MGRRCWLGLGGECGDRGWYPDSALLLQLLDVDDDQSPAEGDGLKLESNDELINPPTRLV